MGWNLDTFVTAVRRIACRVVRFPPVSREPPADTLDLPCTGQTISLVLTLERRAVAFDALDEGVLQRAILCVANLLDVDEEITDVRLYAGLTVWRLQSRRRFAFYDTLAASVAPTPFNPAAVHRVLRVAEV